MGSVSRVPDPVLVSGRRDALPARDPGRAGEPSLLASAQAGSGLSAAVLARFITDFYCTFELTTLRKGEEKRQTRSWLPH